MKKILCLSFILGLSVSYAQNFYKSLDSKSFEDIQAHGIVYITPNEKLDSIFQATMEKHWTATPFKKYDAEADGPLREDQVVLFRTKTSGMETIVGLVPGKHITGSGKMFSDPSFTLYETIGCFMMDGFQYDESQKLHNYFFEHAVSSLNMCVESVLNEDLYSGGSINGKIAQHVLAQKKTKVLKEKTLLLVDYASAYVKDKELDAYGVKYKKITTAEMLEMIGDDVSEYCILYISTTFDSGNLSIFDLETAAMIYYRRFEVGGGLMRLTKSDLEKILES